RRAGAPLHPHGHDPGPGAPRRAVRGRDHAGRGAGGAGGCAPPGPCAGVVAARRAPRAPSGSAAGDRGGGGRGVRRRDLGSRRGDARGRQHLRRDAGHDDGHRAGDAPGQFRRSHGPRADPPVDRVRREPLPHPGAAGPEAVRPGPGAGAAVTRVAHPTDRGGPGEPTARPESPVLSAEGLQRRYGGRLVLDVDRIDVRRSEVLAVLGPNGAGKSTLFRLLLLLERPDAGRIHFEGRAVSPGDRAAMRRMAGVFQRPMLFAGSVESNVALGLRARGVPRRERARRVAEALAWVGLERLAHVPVGTLSGGEAQRVALARALVVEPDVLLLDEPTANLDVTVRRRFREDLERLVRQRAGAVVLITHDPAEAFAIADRVAVIQEGRIVQVGTPTDVVMDPATPFVAAFTGAELL